MKCTVRKDNEKKSNCYEVDDYGLAGVTRLMIQSLRAEKPQGKGDRNPSCPRFKSSNASIRAERAQA